MPNRWTDAELEILVTGFPTKGSHGLKEQLNRSRQAIQAKADQLGLRPLKRRRGRPSSLLRPSNEELRRLYEDEHLTVKGIGEQLGVHPATVGVWIHDANIPTRWMDFRGDGGSRGTVERICPACGKTFWTWPSVIALGRKTYCSNPCANKGRKESMSGRKFTEEHKAKMSESRRFGASEKVGNPRPVETERLCPRCHEIKPVADFPVTHRSKAKVCTACRTMRIRVWNRGKRYGIDTEGYDALLTSQGGGCGICGKPCTNRDLDVDHDHITGHVRGLLCIDCNHALGRLHDSVALLQRAAEYLSNALERQH